LAPTAGKVPPVRPSPSLRRMMLDLFRLILLPALLLATPASAREPLPQATPDYPAARLGQPGCASASAPPERPAGLAELVDIALCRAPATRAAWAGVRAAAEREVQARAAYGPRIDASIGPDASYSRVSGGGFPVVTDSAASLTAQLSLSWLLFDFGGREARIDAAEAGRAGALASFADRAQALVLETGTAYNSAVAAAQAVDAAQANLRFAQTSLDAATARERAGITIKSDRLQADAAYARALLQLRQAEGAQQTQQGRLATALSFAPTLKIPLAGPTPIGAAAALRASADSLIAQADRLRPDLRLQEASAAQARAFVAQAEAARRPSVSLGAGPSLTGGTSRQDIASGSAGLTLSIPLGDSGGRTSVVREARAEAEQAEANLADSRQQVALDVWSRYQTLSVDAANLETARRLLASADEAAALAQGRYRAGLATITELLDAQSSLASAREQLVSAELNVRSSELQLARAVGQIGDTIPDTGSP
jgi:outer membrane protein